MNEKSKYIKYYEGILSNFINHLTEEEIIKAKKKASEGFEYLTSGYESDLESLSENASYDLNLGENNDKRNQEIFIKDIKFISLCKHHLMPFFGSCEITYSPKEKIIGFSRVVKIIKALSLRMQLQENLTKEIADILIKIIDPKALIVKIDAIHTCMIIGNNEDANKIVTIENYNK